MTNPMLPIQEIKIMAPELHQRAINSLTWLITDAKVRFDDCRDNLEPGSQGGYSPELTEADAVLTALKMDPPK